MADSATQTIEGSTHLNNGLWGPYWVSTDVGGMIFGDAGVDPQGVKTIDKGATWGTSVEAETSNMKALAAAFIPQTVGLTDDKIAVVYIGGSGSTTLRFTAYDISANSWSTPVSASGAFTGNATQFVHKAFICVTRAGGYVVGWVNATDGNSGCRKSDDGTTWADAANPFETNANDPVLGVYCDTDDDADAAIIFGDSSAAAYSIKVYDDSADTWTETAIFTGTAVSTVYKNFDASTRLSDGHVIFTAWNDLDTSTADLLAYDLNINSVASPSVTALTTVLTNPGAEHVLCSVFINQVNDDIYVSYANGGTWETSVPVTYALSEDNGTTWASVDNAYTETDDDYKMIGSTAMTTAGRFQPMAFDDDDLVIVYNQVNDVEIEAASGSVTLLLQKRYSFLGKI